MSKLASIEVIKEIKPIKDADRIELAFCLGYQAVVVKGTFKVGDKIVFIQPDCVLGNQEWAQFYKAKSNRIKAIRLKKQWSEGVIESLNKLGLDSNLEIGAEVSDLLNITHYEPPVPQSLDAKGNLKYGIEKTDEERFNNLEEIPYGQEVIVTLKIDGQSASYFCKNIQPQNTWETGVTSRSLELKLESNNNYTRIEKKYDILNKLKDYCIKENKSYCLRGECFGIGVQSFNDNPHSKLPLDFAVFNLLNLDTMTYENFDKCVEVCKLLNIPTVPIIERSILTPELIKKYSEDLETINGQFYEGVVIKGNGFSFKVISKKYDSQK